MHSEIAFGIRLGTVCCHSSGSSRTHDVTRCANTFCQAFFHLERAGQNFCCYECLPDSKGSEAVGIAAARAQKKGRNNQRPGKFEYVVSIAAHCQHDEDSRLDAALVDVGSRTRNGPTQQLRLCRQVKSVLLAIGGTLGSAAATKIQKGRCDSTSRSERICLPIRKHNSTKSRSVSTNVHGRPWVLRARRVDFEPVLHRPLETTRLRGTWPSTTNLPRS